MYSRKLTALLLTTALLYVAIIFLSDPTWQDNFIVAYIVTIYTLPSIIICALLTIILERKTVTYFSIKGYLIILGAAFVYASLLASFIVDKSLYGVLFALKIALPATTVFYLVDVCIHKLQTK